MTTVSDLTLIDLCRELHQTSSSSLGGGVRKDVKDDNPHDDNERILSPIDGILENQLHENDHQSNDGPDDEDEEEDAESGKHLSFEEFRKQTEELSLFLNNFKQSRIDREREDEELQKQSYVEERSAAYSELDGMVSYINTVKATFTPPEKEKPQKREKKAPVNPSQLVGKGKYASKKGRKTVVSLNSDDPDATLTTISTNFSSPREADDEDERHSDADTSDFNDFRMKSSELYNDEGENTSVSEDSEVCLSLIVSLSFFPQFEHPIKDNRTNGLSNPNPNNNKSPSQNSGFWSGIFACTSGIFFPLLLISPFLE